MCSQCLMHFKSSDGTVYAPDQSAPYCKSLSTQTLQAERYGFKSQLSHSLAVKPYTSDLPSRSFRFPICKMGIRRLPTSLRYCVKSKCDDSRDKVHRGLSHCAHTLFLPKRTFPPTLLHHLHFLHLLSSQDWLCAPSSQTLQPPSTTLQANHSEKQDN